MRLFFASTAVALSLAGCPKQSLFPTCEDPNHPCAPVEPDWLDSGATAEQACATLERLHCPEAHPTKTGASCAEVLGHAAVLVDMQLGCIANAKDSESVRLCGTVRCAQ